MSRSLSPGRAKAGAGLALVLATVLFSAGADGGSSIAVDLGPTIETAKRLAQPALAWYRRTPPAERVTWGGLAAAAALGLCVLLERSVRTRPRRAVPRDFVARFVTRLQDGKLDRGKALDYCELNPSPAARVALAAIRRWDRLGADQERAVAMTCRLESDRLRRNVGTLRRIAALAPLLGLLGTLVSAGRTLSAATAATAWGPVLAAALAPLTAGVVLAILALVAYDGLTARIELLVGRLERVGAETVDAIAMAAPPEPRTVRTPHSVRLEVPEPHLRVPQRDADRV
jgi:biopolymer transport protein ExbB